MTQPNQTRPRASVNDREDEPDLEDEEEEGTEDTAKRRGRKPKERPIITESQALKKRPEFVKNIKASAQSYLTEITNEMKNVDVGHPHYSDLKFARIRAERVLRAMDELSRGKPAPR